VKLSPPSDKKITHVIVNGAECEPYLTSDHRLMTETPDAVLLGLRVVMHIFGLNEGNVGIELNKPDAIEVMQKAAEKYGNIHILPLKTKYPQGAEKQLINAVTKKVVPSGGLPADVGCVVINVDTAVSIGNIFTTGMPLVSRIVTVSGNCVAEPCNYEVLTGTPVSYVFDSAGGFIKEPKKIIAGGPMMGTALFSLDVPIIKTSSGILAVSTLSENFDEDAVCIRCGKCVNMCPMHLMPLYLNKYARENNVEMAEKYNVMDCIECGVCSYLCPGKQHPVQNIRLMKQIIAEKRRNQQKK
jgi:electron transport complex protein RnfC